MTGVTKRFFIGMAIFAVAVMVLFGTGQLKTSAIKTSVEGTYVNDQAK